MIVIHLKESKSDVKFQSLSAKLFSYAYFMVSPQVKPNSQLKLTTKDPGDAECLKNSWCSCSLLRGAEEMGLRKAVKPEFGGGTRNFSCEEDYIYENIESELCFFTSQVGVSLCLAEKQITSWSECFWQKILVFSLQERQSIIKHWLDNLRAKHGEALHNITFLGGQPISKWQAWGTDWNSCLMCVHCTSRFLKGFNDLCFCVTICSPGAESQRCDPAGVSSPWAEDPQSPHEVLGPGCLWKAAFGLVFHIS